MTPTRRQLLAGSLVALLLPDEGEARVGGGHSYDDGGGSFNAGGSSGGSFGSSGSSGGSWGSSGGSFGSSGGSSSSSPFGSSSRRRRSSSAPTPSSPRTASGGSSSGLALLIMMGIPFFLMAFVIRAQNAQAERQRRHAANYAPPVRLQAQLPAAAKKKEPAKKAPAPSAPGPWDRERLRRADPNFSMTLFLDFVALLYARAHELRGRGELDKLAPYIPPKLRAALAKLSPGVTEVREVVVGAARVRDVTFSTSWTELTVQLESNYTEVGHGRPQRMHCKETWTFRRRPGVLSPGPERMRALVCPKCGSSAEAKADGTCPSCEAPRGGGQGQWELCKLTWDREPLGMLLLSTGAGVERGFDHPTRVDADLSAGLRALLAGDPDFKLGAFEAQAKQVFVTLQRAWGDLDWEPTRPLQTEHLYRLHQLWIDRYKAEGYRNHVDDVHILKVELARVEVDAWVEAITLRVFAKMLDWTVHPSGDTVGGSQYDPRTFSEYWTFVRSAGVAERRPWDPKLCPSCGAPADQVNRSGICGYCEAHVTSGAFNWVLSRIEQDESYKG